MIVYEGAFFLPMMSSHLNGDTQPRKKVRDVCLEGGEGRVPPQVFVPKKFLKGA